MRRTLSFILALLTLTSLFTACGETAEPEQTTTAETDIQADSDTHTEDTEMEKEDSLQLIPDREFRTGMNQISQKDHANGDAISLLRMHSFYGDTVTNPVWQLAQWDSGPCMVANEVYQGPKVITDGKWRTFGYDSDTDIMTFHLDTSLYYNGKPALAGEYWPHLLIEQADFGYTSMTDEQKKYYSCASEKIILSMDIRLTVYEHTAVEGNWVDAAQFLLYFYVKGINTNDFCWFGVQLFDNRWARNENYIGYDGGKPDASGAMIFTIGSKFVYPSGSPNIWKNGAPAVSDDWVHIEIDIRPYLDQMFEKGKADNYFKAESLEGLCINGMNMGWETIATFDHTMQVKNLKLTAYPGK